MAVFSTLAATIGGTFIGSLFVAGLKAVVGIGINKLAQRLNGRGDDGAGSFAVRGQMQRGADLPQSYLSGYTATAGSLVYANTWAGDSDTPNAFLTMIITLSDLPMQSLDAVWVNGQKGSISGAPHPLFGHPIPEWHRDASDHVWIRFYDGTQTQADHMVVNHVSTPERPWPATSVGVGNAYVVVTVKVNRDLFSGFPTFIFEGQGFGFYDPSRDDTVGGVGPQRFDDPTTWGGDGDHLPAVKLYNMLRGITYGGEWFYGMQSASEAQIPVGHWIQQIEKCRTEVQGQNGLEPQYRSGGEISVGEPIADAMQAELDACNGRITEAGGVYKLYLGTPDAPVASFSDADILSSEEQTFTPFFGLADTVNGINGQFPDPAQAWQPETAPPLNRTDLEVEDGARRLMVNVPFDLVPYQEQVQRLMLAALNEARRARRHTFTLPPNYWPVEPGDVVEFTSERNGYAVKRFRVDGALDHPNADVMFDLTEIDPADYSFDTDVDFTSVGGGSVVSPVYPPQPIAGWTAEAASIDDTAGVGRLPAIRIAWDGAVLDVAGVLVRVRLKSTSAIVFSGRFDDVSAGVALIAQGILPDTEYEVQGRYIPGSPRPIDWSDWLTVLTLDIRPGLPDLAAEVAAAISDAQATADGAASDAIQAQQDAADVQADHDALTSGFAGTLDAAFAQRDAGIAATAGAVDDLRAENEAHIAPLGVSVLREPRSLWSRDVHLARPDLLKPAVTTGMFITDDADFGECFEFGGVYNTSLGPAYPVEFDPNRVYRITARYKVVDDNGGAGVRLHLGVTTQTGTALVQSNIQSELHNPWLLAADGPQTSVRYVSGDATALDAYGIAGSDQIVLTGSESANKLYPHVRQNSGSSTSGKVRVASIEVADVTEALSGVNALRTELQSNIDGISATLTSDYYTAVGTDQAISAAVTTLSTSIAGLGADITDIKALEVSGATAFGTLMQQLQVDAGGVSATITNHASAVADLNGFSSAFAGVTVDTNGGNIAGFRATSFANPDGSGSGVLELLGDVVAEGTLSTNKLVVGLGRNLLSNTDFSDGLQGWNLVASGDQNGETSISLRPPGAWAGAYFPVLQIHQDGSGAYGFADVRHRPFITDGVLSFGVPVAPGDWIEASAQLSIHRCVAELRIQYFDAAGASLSYSPVLGAGNDVISSSTNPDVWPVYWGKHQVPSNAAFATVHIRKGSTNSGSNSFLMVHKPQLAVSHESATQPAQYSPGGTTLISGDKLMTGAITAESGVIAEAAIGAAQIADASVGTLKIAGQAVTIPVTQTDLAPIAGSQAWVTAQQLAITLPEPGMLNVQWQGQHGYAGGAVIHGLRLRINDDLIFERAATAFNDYPALLHSQSLPAGTHMVKIDWYGGPGLTLSQRTLILNGFMR